YEMNKRSVELTINTIVSEFDLFNEISVIDTLGQIMASTSFEEKILKKFSSNGIVSTILNGLSYQSEVYVSEEHLPLLDIAEPIKLYDEIVGILYAVVDLKAMWDLVQENVVGEKGEAFIFNKEGAYIAHSDAKYVYSKKVFHNQAIIDKIRRGENGEAIYKTDQNIEMVAAYAPIGNYGWGAMIQQPTSEAFAPSNRMRVRVIQFMFVSIFLASLLAYFYSRWIVKPVNHLVSGMDKFSEGELHYRIEKVSSDEIGMLAENFNEMAERLIEYQNTLKRNERLQTLGKLASVLSHEIRNPLNSMVINMQILKREFSKQKVNKERVEKFYGILATEIKRVDQLVTDFLLIARPPKLQRTKVVLNKVLDEVLVMQIADSLKKGIRVERVYDNAPIEANVDVAKIRQVFLNLLLNAIQAMPGGGKLKIVLKKSDGLARSKRPLKGKGIIISFIDSGHGIKEEDMSKIFDFYYSTKKEGSGLGLAIVQQIVEEHHGSISVDSKVNKGTTFTIHLPQE
ncbi:MAG: ATP-binding protein, partial [bacterium]